VTTSPTLAEEARERDAGDGREGGNGVALAPLDLVAEAHEREALRRTLVGSLAELRQWDAWSVESRHAYLTAAGLL